MKVKKLKNAYLVRLEYGEELQNSLVEFALKFKVYGGFFHGLGGATSAVLGIYRIDNAKEYEFRDFAGPLEIVSLNGTIAQDENGEVMIHTHATISGLDLNVSGGHVKEMMIGGTCEIFIDTRSGDLKRVHDNDIGLKLLEFDEK